MVRKSWRLVAVLTVVLACLFVGIACAEAVTQKAMFPIQTSTCITQVCESSVPEGDWFSHYPVDMHAIDVCWANAYAPFDCKVVEILPANYGNVVIFESLEPVKMRSGLVDYVHVAFVHTYDLSSYYIGKEYRQGEHCYSQGDTGVPGNVHIHIEPRIGKYADYCNTTWSDIYYEGRLTGLKTYGGGWAYLKNKPESNLQSVFFVPDTTIFKLSDEIKDYTWLADAVQIWINRWNNNEPHTTTWYNHYINTTTPDAIHQDMSDTNPQVNGWVEYDVNRKLVEAGCFLSTTKSAVEGASRGNSNGTFSMRDEASAGLLYQLNSAQTAKQTRVAYTLQGSTANAMGFGMNSSNLPKPGQTVYYKYYSVLDNGEVKYSSSVQSFTMPGTPVVTTYALTATAATGGTVNTSVNGSYEAGKVISLSATPSSGYMFSGWTSSNGGTFGSAGSASTTFTMPAGAATVTANFVKINCSLSISPSSVDFGSMESGYTSAGSRTVTITNNGNVTAALSISSSSRYTLACSNTTLVPGASATVTITPKTGLAAGTYSETISINATASGSGIVSGYSVKLSFTVTAPAAVEEGWSTTKPSGNYITKTQYRSRIKSTTTSSSSTLSGWTHYDTTVGAWGSWSAWSNTAVTASTDCEVETQTIPAVTKTTYSYSCYLGTRSDGVVATSPVHYTNWSGVTYLTAGPFDTPLGYLGEFDGYSGYGYYQNYVWFNQTTNTEIVTPAYTQYRYRTRTRTYHFYQWSSWSAWQDAAITATATKEVEQRTLYRAQPNSVSLNYSSTSLDVGGSVALSATISPSTVPDKGITWSSSNSAVATVSANGTVTAVAAGQAVITAKTVNNLTAQCTVTVKQPVTSISLSSSSVELAIDLTRPSAASTTLTATVLPADATNKQVFWYSDNSQIASVDSNGCITARKAGTTYVYALSENGVSAKCQVTVKQYPAMLAISQSKVAFEFDAADATLAKPVQMNVTVLPEETNDKTLTWHSANSSVASVDANGLVTPVAVGTTTVYATSQNGLQVSCNVTVIQHATSVTVNRTAVYLCLSGQDFGNSASVTAYIAPVNSTENQVIWMSANENVATVQNGVIVAKSAGSTTVTASTANGCKATVQVYVQDADALVLPSAIDSVEEEAFMNVSAVQVVRIPDGTTSIGNRAFAGCQNLKAVYIPASVTVIGTDAFSNCEMLCIYCPSGSTAEQYALSQRITFVLVD